MIEGLLVGCACDKSLSAYAVPSSCLAVSVGVGVRVSLSWIQVVCL